MNRTEKQNRIWARVAKDRAKLKSNTDALQECLEIISYDKNNAVTHLETRDISKLHTIIVTALQK